MQPSSKTTALLLIVVMAAAGVALLYLPGVVIEQYERGKALGPTWGYVYFILVALGALLLLAATVWTLFRLWRATRRKRQRRQQQATSPSQLSAAQQQEELQSNLASVQQLESQPGVSRELREQLKPMAERIQRKHQSQSLEIVAFGTISSGKSSLLNMLAGREVFATDVRGGTTLRRNEIPWPGADRVTLVDTPGLGEVDGAARQAGAAEAARDADLVLLVVDGPLRDSEFALLEMLAQMEKRVLICLNKEDWYDTRQRELLLGQIKQQVERLVQPDDVVPVRSRPGQRSRTRVSADQTQTTETVEVAPDIEPLAERMMSIVRHDGHDLLLANMLLQSRGLVEQARQRVQDALDARARGIVDRYMWGAGGAAALSPFPVVDLAAGCAVSTKMVLDLARVYQQDVDLELAVRLVGQLGKNLLGVLGTSAATPALTAVVASMLKTVPGVGTLAGGVLQGLVQALITRWIGAVFITYFKNEMQEPPGGMAALARREWDRVTSLAELRKLAQTARSRLQHINDNSRH